MSFSLGEVLGLLTVIVGLTTYLVIIAINLKHLKDNLRDIEQDNKAFAKEVREKFAEILKILHKKD